MSEENEKLVKNLDKLLFEDSGEAPKDVRQRLEAKGIDVKGLIARVKAAVEKAKEWQAAEIVKLEDQILELSSECEHYKMLTRELGQELKLAQSAAAQYLALTGKSDEVIYVCNKCGYAGATMQHEGCNYNATPAAAAGQKKWTVKKQGDWAVLLCGNHEVHFRIEQFQLLTTVCEHHNATLQSGFDVETWKRNFDLSMEKINKLESQQSDDTKRLESFIRQARLDLSNDDPIAAAQTLDAAMRKDGL